MSSIKKITYHMMQQKEENLPEEEEQKEENITEENQQIEKNIQEDEQQKIPYNSIKKTTDHRRSSREESTCHRKILRKKRIRYTEEQWKEDKFIGKIIRKKRNVLRSNYGNYSGPRKYAVYRD